jgi:predicted naringenin-chalcone synthase
MSVYLHHIETAVPKTAYPQTFIAEAMKRWAGKGDRKQERIISYLYSQSGIETRHSAIPDFLPGAEPGIFYNGQTDTLRNPTTGERNALYTQEAKRLGAEVACKAFGNASGFDTSDVTHVVTASCTGFFQPGLDYHLVRTLNLPPSVPRFHLGFMGCYAAFPALRLAKTICETDPDAVVLVVSLELCSLHLRFDGDTDALLGGSVFADGAAAAIVSAATGRGGIRLAVGAVRHDANPDRRGRHGLDHRRQRLRDAFVVVRAGDSAHQYRGGDEADPRRFRFARRRCRSLGGPSRRAGYNRQSPFRVGSL